MSTTNKSAADILTAAVNILKTVPYRTDYERENFLFGNLPPGPRLLLLLCNEINRLYSEYSTVIEDWERIVIEKEMNIINNKIEQTKLLIGEDFNNELEKAEPKHWIEELAKRASIEALVQKITYENMSTMLKLSPTEYEEAITKCQVYLNAINKVTRGAERKANAVGNS